MAQVQEVSHPVVRTHPENGRRALFVSEGFTTRIEGLPQDESDALLAELYAHSVRPEHVYRHHWREHDLVFWDNRSLIHLAGGTLTICAASCTAPPSRATRRSERARASSESTPRTAPRLIHKEHHAFVRRRKDRFAQVLTSAGLALVLAVLALASPSPAQAEGRIRIAEQYGIVYLLLNVARDQQLIEKHGKAEGVDISVEWASCPAARR